MRKTSVTVIIAVSTLAVEVLDLLVPLLVSQSHHQIAQASVVGDTKHAAFSGSMHVMIQGLQNLDTFGCRTPVRTPIDPVEISRVRANLRQIGASSVEALRLFDNVMGTGEVPPNPVRSLDAMDALAKAELGDSWWTSENAQPSSHDALLSLNRAPDPPHPTCPDYQTVASR